MKLFFGVVEDRNDPLFLGRCRCRIVGLHTDNKVDLPTDDLPWAYPMTPITSAAMNGIGQAPVGPVEGTWVVVSFLDEENQNPIMIGTVGGIPQSKETKSMAADVGTDTVPSNTVRTGSGGIVVDGSGNPVTSGVPTTIGTGPVNATNTTPSGLKTTKPYPKVKDVGKAQDGINALLSACDTVGITTANAKAAVLAICGGECGWVPTTENLNYSKERLAVVWPGKFKNNPALQEQCAHNPETLGNTVYCNKIGNGKYETGDGYKYRGRGMIQLTGKDNYKYFAKRTGLDILNNPDLLNTDINASALVAATFIYDKVSVAQKDLAYFTAAKTRVNPGASPELDAKKDLYYGWFYGADTIVPSSKDGNKVDEDANPSYKPTVEQPNPSPGILKQQSMPSVGFTDPNGKYPLQGYLKEPDTNRLARSIVTATSVEYKDATRLIGAPTTDGDTWDQPPVPYSSVYPFNHVFESESGHVQEFDDTPDYERINIMHRKGTFLEIDPNGTQVNRIVGDNYSITDRNGFVYAQGDLSITVIGNIKIFCESDANIEVYGDTTAVLHGNLNVGVADDVNVAVGGSVDMLVEGNMTSQIKGNYSMNVEGNYSMKVNGSAKTNASSTTTETAGEQHHLAGGIIALDGAQVQLNGQFAQGTGDLTKPADTVEVPGEIGAQGISMIPLQPPARLIEDLSVYESADEISTPADTEAAAQIKSNAIQQDVIADASTVPVPVVSETGGLTGATTPSETAKTIPPVVPVPNTANKADSNQIKSMTSFPESYKLTDRVRLSDLIMPGNTLQPMAGLTINQIVENLANLAKTVIEPIYDAVGQSGIIITSGFRSKLPPGGSTASKHFIGCAVDFQPRGKVNDADATFAFINKINGLFPYDQLIIEYRDPGKNGNTKNTRTIWIHAGITPNFTGMRKMAFTMLNDKTYSSSGLVLLT